MAILFRDLAMPEIVFSEQNKKLTENRTEMKGAELMSGKRTDYLTWDEYFMGVAMLSGDAIKKTRIRRLAVVLSVRIIKSSLWDIMDFR